jgi:hypothetical protein
VIRVAAVQRCRISGAPMDATNCSPILLLPQESWRPLDAVVRRRPIFSGLSAEQAAARETAWRLAFLRPATLAHRDCEEGATDAQGRGFDSHGRCEALRWWHDATNPGTA